jgi:hypothetical protein
MRIKIKPWIYFLLGLLLAFALATCQTPNMSTNYSTKVEPLPEVAPLSAPEISDWIEQISPTDEAEPLAQIRIKFKDPVIPLESLDSPEQQEKTQIICNSASFTRSVSVFDSAHGGFSSRRTPAEIHANSSDP